MNDPKLLMQIQLGMLHHKDAKKYLYNINGKHYVVVDTKEAKCVIGTDYNYVFDKVSGDFIRWGETMEADPQFSPIGPELADIEITTSCNGIPDKTGVKSPCRFCYKSNTPQGKYMTLEEFKRVFSKLPHSVNQIAFGLDSECRTNPEWFEIFKYTRDNGVIPNVTVANIDDETADKLASICGATAVSRYSNKDVCYDTIKKLTDRGMTQINIHQLVAECSYDDIIETMKDAKTDPRLAKLNAIVLLSLKKKGRGKTLDQLGREKFEGIVKYALDNEIKIGFDSCSCFRFLQTVKDYPNYKEMEMVSEPCESTGFSVYVSVDGIFYPCSFCDGESNWEEGISVIDCNDFLKEVWYHPRVVEFRDKLVKNDRRCPIFEIER